MRPGGIEEAIAEKSMHAKAMKTVVMLATFHEWQTLGHDRNSALQERLAYLISKFGVQTVMEEWSEKHESFAKAFATKTGLHWADVGTPLEPSFQTYYGPINFPGHDGTLPYDPDSPSLNEYGPFENQEARENYMANNIKAEMEGYKTGAFILGVAHLHSLLAKLRSYGFRVVAYSWLA